MDGSRAMTPEAQHDRYNQLQIGFNLNGLDCCSCCVLMLGWRIDTPRAGACRHPKRWKNWPSKPTGDSLWHPRSKKPICPRNTGNPPYPIPAPARGHQSRSSSGACQKYRGTSCAFHVVGATASSRFKRPTRSASMARKRSGRTRGGGCSTIAVRTAPEATRMTVAGLRFRASSSESIADPIRLHGMA
jgi:hypothetical protein